jgi:PAS domain S-box-containing protein
VHPDDVDRCRATYASSFEAQRNFQVEYRLKRADGEYRWILDHGLPRYREDEFIGFIGSCIDVTEQKLIEERLRTNEVRFLNTHRLAKIGNWELDVETGKIHWSDEMFEMYGLRENASRDFATFLSAVHPGDRAIVEETRVKALSSTAPVSVEFRIIRPDGEVRFARSIVEALKDDRGSTVRLVGAAQDITDQVNSREILRESERRLQNAERLAHVGNWQWDIRTNSVSGSGEMFRIFGKPENHIPNYEGFLQDLLPSDRERMQRLIGDSLVSKIGHSMEYQIAHPDGDLRTISCIWEVSLDDEGKPAKIFGTCQDISDSRRAQDEVFRRQKLESVGTLANGIAHDFNNLLGAVLAQTELAAEQLASGSSPEKELHQIQGVATKGAEIVRQLMVYAGKESDTPAPVDVSQIVAEMLDLLKVSVSKGAVLETDLGKNLPAVRATAAQLRQVVLNLLTNASEAIGDREGVIRVITSRIRIGRVVAISKGVPEGDYLQLEVSDTGSGMAPDTQARALDPFFTTKPLGRGLGLAVVQGIVQNLCGAIHLASEAGKGTTFQILLPCAEAGTGAIAHPVPHAEEPVFFSTEATILLVEDEDPLRQALAKMLRKQGFEVLEAANGSTAIDLVRSNASRIDAILLDMTIPGPSSRDVITEANQARPDSKVILTSAYSEEMVMATMNSPLICGFIRKPFRFGDLLQTFQKVLSP